VGLDHATLVTKLDHETAAGIIDECLQDGHTGMHYGAMTYASRYEWHEYDVKMFWTEGREEAAVVITGSACRALTVETVLTIAAALDAKATRLDVCIDGASFSPEEFYKHVTGGAAGQIVNARCRSNGCSFLQNAEGSTVYVGSRKSMRMLRVYDAHGYTRVELEAKKDAAQALLARFYAVGTSDAAVAALVGGVVVDFIAVTKLEHAHLEPRRRQLADWWADFVAGFQAAGLRYTQRVQVTLEKYRNYLRDNAVTFAVCQQLAIWDAEVRSVTQQVTLGRERIKPKHRRLLALARYNNLRGRFVIT
jgi:hypothetical protein